MAGTGPAAIWAALIAAGASSVQAAGIMGNFIAESSLNPETGKGGTAIDSNGYPVYGLASWNTASYPNAGELVTGNVAADIVAQIQFLTSTGGLQAASGTTVSETAGNFAANYERCQGCEAGGSQNTQRIANAQQVAGWAASGDWPAGSGQAATSATLTAAENAEVTSAVQQAQSNCAWGVGSILGVPASGLATIFGGIGGTLLGGSTSGDYICLISKPQVRGITGVLLMIGGTSIIAFGALLLMGATGYTPASVVMRTAAPVTGALRAFGVPAGP